MGLFDKKNPREKVEITSARNGVGDPADEFSDDDAALDDELDPDDAEDSSPSGEFETEPAEAGPSPDYGIEQILGLMRILPVKQNRELVAEVVKKTLESANIDYSGVINDASSRQQDVQQGIAELNDAIAQLDAEIAERERQVASLETDLEQVTQAKNLLQLAQQMQQGTAKPGG